MKLILIQLVLVFNLCEKTCGSFNNKSLGIEIAGFISRLIRDYNVKYPNQIHDVAVLKIENEEESDVFGEIVSKMPRENAVLIPSNGNALRDQKIRAAKFVIVISDINDFVSFWLLRLAMLL